MFSKGSSDEARLLIDKETERTHADADHCSGIVRQAQRLSSSRPDSVGYVDIGKNRDEGRR